MYRGLRRLNSPVAVMSRGLRFITSPVAAVFLGVRLLNLAVQQLVSVWFETIKFSSSTAGICTVWY